MLTRPASLESIANALGVSIESARRFANRLIAKDLVVRNGGQASRTPPTPVASNTQGRDRTTGTPAGTAYTPESGSSDFSVA
jgi:predicted ArsR family transcriptional regulator